MNTIILRNESELNGIPNSDYRAKHIRNILRMKDGDEVFVGIINSDLTKRKLIFENEIIRFSKEFTLLKNPKVIEVTLCVAYSRPQIAKRIMFEASSFGVKNLFFYPSERSETSYSKSSLYNSEFIDEFVRGAEQSCSTSIPNFKCFDSLQKILDYFENQNIKELIAPDLYESQTTMKNALSNSKGHKALIFGSERGFTNPERILLRKNNVKLVSIGERVLRTDTAVIAGLTLCLP